MKKTEKALYDKRLYLESVVDSAFLSSHSKDPLPPERLFRLLQENKTLLKPQCLIGT